MADKVRREPKAQNKDEIFMRIRKRMAERLADPGLKGREHVSPLEAAIGTFAPSEYLAGFVMSDYPFIGSRYLSVVDGHVYIVAGATDDGQQVMAYRLGFVQSNFTHRGGIAVGITEDAWMDSLMIMFSLEHAAFNMVAGQLEEINSEYTSRRTFPIKKAKAFFAYLKKEYFSQLSWPGMRSKPHE
jgi:hypothetical protein